MLKDLFSNRLFIGALAFFVVCVGGSLIYTQHVDRQGAEYKKETEAHVAQWNENQNAQGAAEVPEEETSPVRHSEVSDGTFHSEQGAKNGADTAARPVSEEDWSDVTPEQRALIKKMRAKQLADYIAEWGEPPSPDGSYKHYQDNHGDVHRHYKGTVAIDNYEYTTMFAPTSEELERYKRLRADLKAATLADVGGSWENPSPEVQRLDTALKSLVKTAQREIPLPNGFRYYGADNSGFPSEAENERLRAIPIREFYQRFEMAHLYELHWERNKFYEKY